MGWWILFAIFLYAACAILIVAEVFLPSGGILGLCSLACLVGGAVIFFSYSTTAGWIGVVVAVVMIPVLLIIAYKIFPKTRFGKSVTLTPPQRERGDAIADSPELSKLLGEVGRVLTPLRPVGVCEFAGRRVECVAESGYVDKGKIVKVIGVQGAQPTVRLME
jgi:membrane-bound ClpP family serine protease